MKKEKREADDVMTVHNRYNGRNDRNCHSIKSTHERIKCTRCHSLIIKNKTLQDVLLLDNNQLPDGDGDSTSHVTLPCH